MIAGLAGTATAATTKTSSFKLLVSTSADRSGAKALNGADISGSVAIFTRPADAKSVSYYLDDSNLQYPIATATKSPYDLVGTTADGKAYLFNTSFLFDTIGRPSGQHSLSAKLTRTDGSTSVTSATFTIKPGSTAPKPTTKPAPSSTSTTSTTAPSTSTSGPSSSQDTRCVGKFPDAACTGPTAATAAYTGSLEIKTAGTVIKNAKINGCVRISAENVQILDSEITCSNFIGILLDDTGASAVVRNSLITCINGGTGVSGGNYSVFNTEITGCENGFDVNSNVSSIGNYVHDVYNGGGAHADGLQLTDHSANVKIIHNTYYSKDGTSAVIMPRLSAGQVSNITVDNNLFAGGAFTVYCQQDGKGNNIQLTNNHFSTIYSSKIGAYGATTDCSDEAVVRGNVIHETGAALNVE